MPHSFIGRRLLVSLLPSTAFNRINTVYYKLTVTQSYRLYGDAVVFNEILNFLHLVLDLSHGALHVEGVHNNVVF